MTGGRAKDEANGCRGNRGHEQRGQCRARRRGLEHDRPDDPEREQRPAQPLERLHEVRRDRKDGRAAERHSEHGERPLVHGQPEQVVLARPVADGHPEHQRRKGGRDGERGEHLQRDP